MYRALTILILLLSCGQTGLHAQAGIIETQMRTLRIPRVSRPPVLDDFLNGVPREAELTVTDFRQYRPGDGDPVSQPTTAFLSYDDQNLYIAFVCKDDPKLIRARLAKHDQIMSDDRTMVNLDTFHDHRHMYFFNVNPYGVQADGTSTDGQGTSSTWDTLWHSDAKITGDGYVALTVIPFKSIRFPSDKAANLGADAGAIHHAEQRVGHLALCQQPAGRLRAARRRPGGTRRHFARTQHPAHSLRPLLEVAVSGHAAGRAGAVSIRQRSSRGTRRQGGVEGRADTRCCAEPRFQPGRVGRAPGHHQPALRSLLPGEAPVLHGQRELLRDTGASILLAAHRRSAVRGAADGKGGEPGPSARCSRTTALPERAWPPATPGAGVTRPWESSACSASFAATPGTRTWRPW